MSTFVELEIQNILGSGSSPTTDVDEISNRIIDAIESSPDYLTSDNIQSMAQFLFRIGAYSQLVNFVVKHFENESFPIPWAYFLEALGKTSEPLDKKILAALAEGVRELEADNEASRSSFFRGKFKELQATFNNRLREKQNDYLKNKRVYLDQLLTLRTQQLFEQERSLLQRLQKLYPEDLEIQQEVSEHKQRYALEILSRKTPRARTLKTQDLTTKDPEVRAVEEALSESLLDFASELPEMALDLAVAAFMLEQYETSLKVLSYAPPDSPSTMWMRLEALLKARRFVELLNEITHVELALSSDAETFFATAYLRAQALWGLGQKHAAIEVMEGLLASRPHYRAGSALLSVWGQQ